MRTKFLIPLMVLAFLVPVASTATAATQQYPHIYGTAGTEDRTVQWRFDNDFPSGAIRTRIIEGANTWDAQAPAMNFDHVPTDVATFGWDDGCAAGYQDNRVGWGDLNAGKTDTYAAVTRAQCFLANGNNKNFRIKFSNDYTWWTSTSTAIPNGQADAIAFGVHEFGHAAGAIHYSEASFGCPSAPSGERSSMCENVVAPGARTLSAIDINDFNAAY